MRTWPQREHLVGTAANANGQGRVGMVGSRSDRVRAAWRCWILGIAALLASSPFPLAQDAQPTVDELTVVSVQSRLAELPNTPDLAPEVLEQVLELWNQTLAQLLLVEENQTRLEQWEQARAAAPATIAELQAKAADAGTIEQLVLPDDTGVPQLETGLAAAQAVLLDKNRARDVIEEEQDRRVNRRRDIPRLVDDLQQRLDSADEDVVAEDAAPELREAQAALARAQRIADRTEIEVLSAEVPLYEAEDALISLRLDETTRLRDEAFVAADTWEKALSAARQEASALAEAEAQEDVDDVADQPEVVRQLAEVTAQHAVRRNELTELQADATVFLAELVDAQNKVNELEKSALEKIAVAGFTNSVAVLLRKQRGELPEIVGVLARQLVPHTSTEIALELIDVRRARVSLGSQREKRVEETLRDIDQAALAEGRPAPIDVEREDLDVVVRELLQSQQAGLFELIAATNRYFDDLNALAFAAERLSASVDEYGRFIDEHILWVRSAAPLSLSDLFLAVDGYASLFSPKEWAATTVALGIELGRRTASVAWAALLVGGLLLLRPLARKQIRLVGERLGTRRLAPITPTLVVLVLSVVRAALWPVVIWLLGWCLSWLSALPLAGSVGSGLMRLSAALIPMVLLAEICRPLGLAEVHLRWPAEVLRSLHRHLWQWQVFVVPALGLALIFDAPGLAEYEAASGRLALMLALVGLALVAYRLTRHKGAVMRTLRIDSAPKLFSHMQWIFFPITVLLPATLVILVALGFQYGGLQVGLGLVHSTTLLLALVVLRGVVRRWLSLARLRLALEQLQRRREARAEEALVGPEVSGEIRAVADEPGEIDVGQIDEQAMRLVDMTFMVTLVMGMMLIWSDLLPALGGLRRVELWQSSITTSVDDGVAITQLVPVSLADVLLALLVAGFTVLSTRNIAGLLEITVLRRLTLEPGGGYAITAVCRYLLTAGGVIAAASLLGITWDSVQWLAAAVSVGLGFGLQEIFANFVSGLIILFERPIRVGDIITVGGIEGVVTRIRTRATTIRDRDRRELLVPNTEFITGQLVNWTLSDPISRLILPVGIAYGSDTKLAERTLVEVASAHSMVLDNPAPNVVFRNFGDSTLDYELRVFIPDRDFWPKVTHELNTAIHNTFAEKGLEIAFPQRDLHLRDASDELLDAWQEARAARGKS
jgi:potassium efflux system protein